MYVGLLCAVLVSVFARGQSNGYVTDGSSTDLCFFVFVCVPSALCVVRRRVCYMTVVETSTISVSVVVSSTQYYSCGFLGWSTCTRLVVQYAVRIVRSQV